MKYFLTPMEMQDILINCVLLTKFPILESCGGYTLMRVAENSHRLVEIEGPDSGMTVAFLKDILNQAKLFIHPLQKDITEEDMKENLPPLVRGTYMYIDCMV